MKVNKYVTLSLALLGSLTSLNSWAGQCLEAAKFNGKVLSTCQETGVTGASELRLLKGDRNEIVLIYCDPMGGTSQMVVLQKTYDARNEPDAGYGAGYISYSATSSNGHEYRLMNELNEENSHHLLVTTNRRDNVLANKEYVCSKYNAP